MSLVPKPISQPPMMGIMGLWDFSRFGLGIKSWKLVPKPISQPLPPYPIMGLWDFSRFGLDIKSCQSFPKPFSLSLLPQWDFGILADLDSASKFGSWSLPPPPPSSFRKFWFSGELDSASEIWSWVRIGNARDHLEPRSRAPRFRPHPKDGGR